MPLSTDSVLLGSWAPIENDQHILEVGMGCAIISLMIAQRNSICHIDTVEIDHASYLQGIENIQNSPWASRITAYHQSFQDFAQQSLKKYDHIICNPPFFHNNLRPDLLSNLISRHNHTLSFTDLLYGSSKLLHAKGKLSVIIPFKQKNIFLREGLKMGLFCIRHTAIQSSASKPFIRSLITLSPSPCPPVENQLILYEGDHKTLTQGFIALTKDFYLDSRLLPKAE
jgi:tRNA1Val (adenine37-N6)-methyltransferase